MPVDGEPAGDVLRLERIAKRLGPTTVLRGVDLRLRPGEVLGLIGAPGAGRSTLVRIISGVEAPDAGRMWVNGRRYAPRGVLDGHRAGIDTVFPDAALIDQLSVYHNLFLGRERVRSPGPLLDDRLMRRQARQILAELGVDIPRVEVAAGRLSRGQRQALALARAVSGEGEIVLLAEPLDTMAAEAAPTVVDLLTRIKAEGRVSVIVVVHHPARVFGLCDRVSLLQDGVISLDKPTRETSIAEVDEVLVEAYRRTLRAIRAGGPA